MRPASRGEGRQRSQQAPTDLAASAAKPWRAFGHSGIERVRAFKDVAGQVPGGLGALFAVCFRRRFADLVA